MRRNIKRPLILFVTTVFSFSSVFAANPQAGISVAQNLTKEIQAKQIKQGTDLLSWARSQKGTIHEKVKNKLIELALTNPKLKMPKIEVSDYKSAGIDYARVYFKFDKENVVLDFHEKDGQLVFKMDGKEQTFEDIYYSPFMENQSLNPQLSLEQVSKVHAFNKQAVRLYQKNFRDLINSVTEVQELSFKGVPKQVSYIDFLLNSAYATYSNGECIVGGNLTKFDPRAPAKDKNICGLNDKKISEGCAPRQFSCNPLIYGFTSAGKAACVDKEKTLPATYVSDKCNQLFPLDNDTDGKKGDAFVSSVLANKDKLSLAKEDDFYKSLTEQIANAGKSCDPDFDPNVFRARVKDRITIKYEEKDFLKGFPPVMAKDKQTGKQVDFAKGHRTACMYMMNRLVLAKKAADCTELKALAADSPDRKDQRFANLECTETVVAPIIAPVPPGPDITVNPPPVADNCAALAAILEKEKAKQVLSGTDLAMIQADDALSKCNLRRTVVAVVPPPEVKPPARVDDVKPKDKPWCFANVQQGVACGLIGLFALCLGKVICGKNETPGALPVGKGGEPTNPRTGTYTPGTSDPDAINRLFPGRGRN